MGKVISENKLGDPIFVCEKYSDEEAFTRATGGFARNLILSLVYSLVGALPIAGLVGTCLGWMREGNQGEFRFHMLTLLAVLSVVFFLVNLFLLFEKRGFAQAVRISLLEKGIEIGLPDGIQQIPYEDLADVYLGTKSKFAQAGLTSTAALEEMANRLSFERKNGKVLRIKRCYAYFHEQAIEDLLLNLVLQGVLTLTEEQKQSLTPEQQKRIEKNLDRS